MNGFQKHLTAMYTYFTLKRVHSSVQVKCFVSINITQMLSIYLRSYDCCNFFSVNTFIMLIYCLARARRSQVLQHWSEGKKVKQSHPKWCLFLQATLLAFYILRLLHIYDCSFKFYALLLQKSLFHSGEKCIKSLP